MGQASSKPPQGVRTAPTASQGYMVTLTVEYDAHTEQEARLRALRDAEYMIQQPDVLSVTADAANKPRLLIPGQMTVEECIADALPVTEKYLAVDELA